MVNELDPERLLAVLVDEGVEFVFVGGYAALVHGSSQPTQDVDITPSSTANNLSRLTRGCSTRCRPRRSPTPCYR